MGAVVAFSSFVSGVVFGVFVCTAALVYALSVNNNNNNNNNSGKDKEKNKQHSSQLSTTKSETASERLSVSKARDAEHLNKLVENLHDFNNPFRTLARDLDAIKPDYIGGTAQLERRMKSIIELQAISRMERETQEKVGEIKDHVKQLKGFSAYMNDLSKVFASFSKDLGKLSSVARVNMNKSGQHSELRNEELIVNNWWQTLHLTLEHMAAGQEDLANTISELVTNATDVQDELILLEKRMTSDCARQFSQMKE